jgi:hypothetical protein
MKRVEEDVVFRLEDQHEVEGARDAERHAVREGALSERIDDEDSGCGDDRCGESDEDPRAHTETIGELPLTTEPSADSDEEVKDDQLIRTAVEEPFLEGESFPDGVEVYAECVGRRDDSSRDDVVAEEE